MSSAASSVEVTSGQAIARGLNRVPRSAAFWGPRFLVLSIAIWASSFVIGFQNALILMVLVCWVAMIAGLQRPILGLMGIGMLSALDPMERVFLLTGGLFRWNTLNYWLLLVMILTLPFLLRLRDLQNRLLEFFLILLLLELPVSRELEIGTQAMLGAVVTFGILYYFARAADDLANLYWLGVTVGGMTASGSVAFFLWMDRLPYINPNAWAYFPLTSLLIICLAFPFTAGQFKGQLILGLLAAVNFIAVFLSASRGDMLIGVGCLIFLVLNIGSISQRLVLVGVAVLVAFAAANQFTDLVAHSLQRLDTLFNPSYSIATRTSGRSDLALAGWLIFQQHPLGVGTGGFARAWADLPIVEGISNFQRGNEFAAHSGWVKVLAENGFPGAFLLASYVLSFTLSGIHSRDRNLLYLGLLVTMTFGLAFISTEYQNKGLWFIAAAVTTLLNKREILASLNRTTGNESTETLTPTKNTHHV